MIYSLCRFCELHNILLSFFFTLVLFPFQDAFWALSALLTDKIHHMHGMCRREAARKEERLLENSSQLYFVEDFMS